MAVVNKKHFSVEEVKKTLIEHGEARITGLGTFYIRKYAPLKYRNPQTGRLERKPAREKVKCRVSTILEKEIKSLNKK